ncbi:MAG: PilZ domain-containing protein [Methylobacterium sp.]|uniref:PilZ domain-containing protein n=1 Tax=Methylobacterium sp. TaxID=409 RepID=UPI0034569756|nr:PilZ domain-containing protein [Methylobacterium sp.]
MTAVASFRLADIPSNRRNFDRTRMNRPVVIFCEAGIRSGDYTMKDMSARGVRIVDCPDLVIAGVVILRMPEEGVRWRCEVVRKSNREIGVEFI